MVNLFSDYFAAPVSYIYQIINHVFYSTTILCFTTLLLVILYLYNLDSAKKQLTDSGDVTIVYLFIN